ncbi:MAG: hypothetical protein ACI8Y4_003339 [Candidatus Poriferisodalaceae bacterium]
MVGIHPFPALIVDEPWLNEVPAPADDAHTPQQRRAYVAAHPRSYLTVTRLVGDGVTDTPDPAGVLAEGVEALRSMLAEDVFLPVGTDVLLVYRLAQNGHSQLGIVAALDVDDIETGLVRTHEDVVPQRAVHLAEHFAAARGQSSPIVLGHPPDASLEALLTNISTSRPPDREFTAPDGLHQAVWAVEDTSDIAQIQDVLAGEPAYVIDGHHRVAASLQYRTIEPGTPSDTTLAALFPTNELRAREYNRWINDLGEVSAADFVCAVGLACVVTKLGPVAEAPGRAGAVSMYADGCWYRVTLPDIDVSDNPRDALDPVRLDRVILGPLLGITEGDTSGRVTFVTATHGLPDFAADVDRRGGVAFVLHPISVDTVVNVAEAGQHMPPKSTFFEPKARPGLFLRLNP